MLLMVTVSIAGAFYKEMPYSAESRISGQIIPMAQAVEALPLEKEVG